MEIQRSFEEPDFSLLSGKQPHEVGCDVPIVWDPSVSNVSDSISTSISTPTSNNNDNNTGVLVFLGVFSAAQSSDKSPAEMRRRRDLYRQIYFPQFPKNLVTAKFILGLPPGGAGKDKFRNPAAAVSRARVLRGLEEEREKFGDMVILDVSGRVFYDTLSVFGDPFFSEDRRADDPCLMFHLKFTFALLSLGISF